MRTFETKKAVRCQVPLLVGLMGASGSGKTYSALRLASGIQRVTGKPVYYVDTEARRALHYADRFDFRHVEFGAPFSSLDYLAAIAHCVNEGAGVVVVDSFSLEHEGVGGVLEQHEAELTRMAGDDHKRRKVMSMLAWQKPKQARRKMINTILQLPCNFIFCFRAKEKIKPVKGQEPQHMGFMPIAGEELIYEHTINCLLYPNSGGVPTWRTDEIGERAMLKLPEQFRDLFARQRPLDEDTGEAMARWAAGGSVSPDKAQKQSAAEQPTETVQDMVNAYAECADAATLKSLETVRAADWGKFSAAEKKALKAAADAAKARLEKESGE